MCVSHKLFRLNAGCEATFCCDVSYGGRAVTQEALITILYHYVRRVEIGGRMEEELRRGEEWPAPCLATHVYKRRGKQTTNYRDKSSGQPQGRLWAGDTLKRGCGRDWECVYSVSAREREIF